MAKQSGLHQIKGKVGEHSYYKQTGVSGGLIRSINQGLSARVKTDPAYANTRLNNQEFGAAADTASLLGKMVAPKFRPMILPFSQSKMSKEVLRLARENSSAWGQRTVSSAQTAQLAAVLSAQSKRAADEFINVSIASSGDNDYDVNFEYSSAQAALMNGLGITGLQVTATIFNLATGNWSAAGQVMLSGYLEYVLSVNGIFTTINTAGDSDSETATFPPFIPAAGHSGHQIAVFVIMPTRTIAGDTHILQEYCSFIALPIVPAE